MLIEYVEKKFARKTLAIIEKANEIIAEYQAEGLKLTLRQLYYQFVARGLIENSDKSYDRLGEAISNARLAGLISWEAIEDITRFVRHNPSWEDPRDILRDTIRWYHIDMWDNQDVRLEVWVEKDAALNGVERICRKMDVPFASCRGYASQSSQWAASNRFQQYEDQGQTPILIYLGDHDPSGIDMGRDHNNRLCEIFGTSVEVRRVALNMDQIEHYRPPPNPAKLTDSRCGGYIKRFGRSSWELDALSPRIIENIVKDVIDEYRDPDKWEERLALREARREALRYFVDKKSPQLRRLLEQRGIAP